MSWSSRAGEETEGIRRKGVGRERGRSPSRTEEGKSQGPTQVSGAALEHTEGMAGPGPV